MSTGPFIPGVGVQLAGGSIYVGPLHPWLTPIEESDGKLHPLGLMDHAFEGRLAPVKAWLDGGGDVNSYAATHGATLLRAVVTANHITAQHLELMRYLISRGADVNHLDWRGEWSPLHMCVCAQSGVVDAIELLLSAGANVNGRKTPQDGRESNTPLCDAIDCLGVESHPPRDRFAIVWALLRAGASLDSCYGVTPIESRLLQVLKHRPNVFSEEYFGRIRDLIYNVRMAGSFKRFAMDPHYDMLTLRGLANRGYITSTDPKLNSLFALPHELLCHVLGYWEPTLPRLLDLNPNFYDT